MSVSKIYYTRIAVIFLMTVLSACSTEKDAAINRGYHNMTARFNGYYNAGVVIETALTGYRSSYTDEYYKIIPLEVYPTEKDAPGLYPDMDKAIEKCERVILRHSMPSQQKKKKNEELCRWIDDNWLVIAKAHYYKREYLLAEQKFNYVQQIYIGEESIYEAQIWLAKTYIALGNFPEAKRILIRVEASMEEAQESRDRKFTEKIKDIKSNRLRKKKNKQKKIIEPAVFPEKLTVDYEATMADFYIQQGEYKQAIEHLEKAIEVCHDKKRRARYMFVLAQLYQAMGDGTMATNYYTKVAHSNAPYEMQFAAKINKAISATSGGDEIRKDLYKMLRDEKNAEFKDQIYYALAEMDIKDGDIPGAKVNYSSSVYWSVKNDRQKGISYLRMADLSFGEKDYVRAQKYYDSCITVLPKDYEGYEAIASKAEGLEELVFHYETVVFEDSVQQIAAMDPDAREKFLKQTLKDLIAAEELRKKQEQERLLATQNKVNTQTGITGEGSKWYFYNVKVRGSGFNDFRAQWGTRPLEDNWRRSDKTSFTLETGDPDNDSLQADEKKDSLTVEDLLADIPLSPGAVDSSNNRLMNSLYMLGVIYKEQLKEEPEAITYFNKVIDRGIEHPRVLEAMYQLYLIYTKKESGEAETYRQMILNRYPDTEIAMVMRDPDYLKKKEEANKKELNDYAITLNDYKQRYYGAVITKCNEVIAYDTTNKFLNKYYLLKAFAVSKTSPGNVEAIASPLKDLYELSPESDEGKQAKIYLDKIYAGGSIVNPDQEQSLYQADSESQHFFIVIVPASAGNNLEANKVKLANFNTEYFRGKRYTVINSVLSGENELLVVKTFANAEEGKQFVAAFTSTSAATIVGTMAKDFEGFLINSANFSTLMTSKDLEAYRVFYAQHYLQ
ncbi:MAG: tetratricopeptide repeat protein [Bacteroidetes bacterium]|nr:tetratricopeptide repeat protein [Bacteroidota bacterium]